jgi:hypothetical protein
VCVVLFLFLFLFPVHKNNFFVCVCGVWGVWVMLRNDFIESEPSGGEGEEGERAQSTGQGRRGTTGHRRAESGEGTRQIRDRDQFEGSRCLMREGIIAKIIAHKHLIYLK